MTPANPFDQLNNASLTAQGLNLQAVFKASHLPAALGDNLDGSLLLLGNGGRAFWDGIPEHLWSDPDPLDRYARQCAEEYMRSEYPGRRYRILYPGDLPVGLQRLGIEAGWHHDSPLKLGINPVFGLWYAYRVLLWVEGELTPTTTVQQESPCEQCEDKPCLSGCPVQALSASDGKQLERCIDYRLVEESPCQSTCLARLRCPVAPQHRYSEQQLNYHYQQSFKTLVKWRK